MIKGTGVDIIEIDRIQHAVERWGEYFLNHIFTSDEIKYAQKFRSPYPHYAGRFAAKEAVYKAMGQNHIGWKDLNIVNDVDGKPHCVFQKPEFQCKIFLSISHSKYYAIAHAIVEA